jgi:hypothetical protein
MVEGQSGEFEPVYLTLADVLELHALIIGATAEDRSVPVQVAPSREPLGRPLIAGRGTTAERRKTA